MVAANLEHQALRILNPGPLNPKPYMPEAIDTPKQLETQSPEILALEDPRLQELTKAPLAWSVWMMRGLSA